MNAVFQQAEALHEKIKTEVIQDAEAFRIQYLGSKGEIKAMFSAMKDYRASKSEKRLGSS